MTQNLTTGVFILLSGLALLILLFAKLIPKTKHDTDTKALLIVFTLVGACLVVMGGWLTLRG
ncbi:hypothetical protein [Levilactobacillus koreensis]|uniref:Uncharacterized protein n=1 Tax=Levilactobacillus koreensis TaxID=637971 RepID=A0AAC8UXV4_9LACO|nr:hypothetical protein [Levilactobacillus koreensis]AKP65230.1 hypothetical protein ABN16_09580 [Levilactobacillus koreensis]